MSRERYLHTASCYTVACQFMADGRKLRCMSAMVLTTFSSRMEADIAVAVLESSGIRAWTLTDSADGFAPQLEFARGVKVVTHEDDLAEAADVLGVVPPDPLPPLSEERERMVQVVRNAIFLAAAGGIVMAVWEFLR
jgi:hypothetical protein